MEDNKAPVILILASFVIVMAGMKAASSLLVWVTPASGGFLLFRVGWVLSAGERLKIAPALKRAVAVFNKPCGLWTR